MKSNIPTLIPGYRSGRLVVLREVESLWDGRLRRRRVLCRCDCGQETTLRANSLRPGGTLSCGCLAREISIELGRRLNITHGKSLMPEFNIWKAMRERCRRENGPAFQHYGGRGITVCERWERSFEAFLADMGKRPTPKHSIERRDNDAPYSPENCVWASQAEQCRNTRRNNRLTLNGETLCLTDWAQRLGTVPQTIQGRLLRGWPIERALTEPVRPRRRKE